VKLRISINARKIDGPYGGGNQFANTLEKHLRNQGHEVLRKLVPNLDLILIVSSQSELRITAYGVDEIRDYISLNPNTMVVHRVNSCDEQRGNNLGINKAILWANQVADYTVFISSFVRDLFAHKGLDTGRPNCVILNGADEEVFHSSDRAEWSPGQKLRVVTHHWGSNFMKGFDIYERLDQLLEVEPFKEVFEFAYIGNIPVGVHFKNSNVITPTAGTDLANRLRQHHVYITAARNEAGGMHHVEGMRCGLPVLYLRSGALPEYCAPYGMEFTLVNLEKKLLKMREYYPDLRERVLGCSYAGTWMAAQYEELFLRLVTERRANPHPRPGLLKVMQLYFVIRPFRRLKRFLELAKKAVEYLR
jgi:glycosyltransferase involved in cell wall biosynthesis